MQHHQGAQHRRHVALHLTVNPHPPDPTCRSGEYPQGLRVPIFSHRDIVLRRSSRAKRTADPVDERLRALVDEHATAIYRVALGVVRDPSLAEDVVQETVIRAWRALPTYNGTGSMRSWVLSIAHNTAVSTLRRIKDEAVVARGPARAHGARRHRGPGRGPSPTRPPPRRARRSSTS